MGMFRILYNKFVVDVNYRKRHRLQLFFIVMVKCIGLKIITVEFIAQSKGNKKNLAYKIFNVLEIFYFGFISSFDENKSLYMSQCIRYLTFFFSV